jgi:hypothetical protein
MDMCVITVGCGMGILLVVTLLCQIFERQSVTVTLVSSLYMFTTNNEEISDIITLFLDCGWYTYQC